MSEQLKFAVPNYVTVVQLQETTDGSYCYVAFHPELPNVISQGDNAEEAKEDLVEATELAIAYLVSSGLPVPEPVIFMCAPNDLTVTESISYKSPPTALSVVCCEDDQDEKIMAPSGQLVRL